jgi:hypothetical protein
MKKIFLFLSVCFLGGCVQPFEVEVDEGEKKLVVNGMITDEPGPYTIKINKTTSYGGFFSDVDRSIEQAEVTISDDLGTTETLRETFPGEFKTLTTGIRGRIGGSYILRIRLKNGREYVSEPETIVPVVPVDRFSFEYKEKVTLDKEKNEIKEPIFELQTSLKDPVKEKNFYKWITVGTYEISTQPEDHSVLDNNGNPVRAPKDCCSQCWIARNDYTAHVIDDRTFNGNSLVSHPVGAVPITPKYLGVKYHVELKQMSLSEKAYNFWKMLESQTAATGSVQDPAPANARGNMRSATNPDEQVLGYFGASAVSKKAIYLRNSDVPFVLPSFEFKDDCRVISGATTKKPTFWQ